MRSILAGILRETPRADWSNSVRTPRDVRYSRALIGRKSVRTPRDVHYSRALIGQTAYVHPVTYAIAAL